MIKLQKFNKQNKLKQIKTIVISGVILIIALISLIVFKSYAYYKQSNSYDVIKSKIGEFSKSDIQLAYTIDGVKQSGGAFPVKGQLASNYIGVVTCDNGVTADWNNELWGLVNINSNNQEKISCKVDFKILKYYYAFGTPTTSSTTDYTTLGKNVFVKLGTDNSKSVCIIDNGLFCLNINEYETSKKVLKEHFGESSCSDGGTYIYCKSEAFYCDADTMNTVNCSDNKTDEYCGIDENGIFNCDIDTGSEGEGEGE